MTKQSKKQWFNLAISNDDPTAVDIHIYNDIGYWGTNAQDFQRELAAAGDVKNINLHINSNGGSLFDGFAIASQIKNSKAFVTAYIDGVAASSASLIAVAANKVVMSPFSFMMVHNPMTDLYSANADEMRKTADTLDNLTNGLINLYQSKTGKSEDEIKSMLDAETWLSGEQAHEQGFADELTDELKVAACTDFGKYSNHIPDDVAVKLEGETEEPEAPEEVEEPETQEEETNAEANDEPEAADSNSDTVTQDDIKNVRARMTGIINACMKADRADLIDAYQESELSAEDVEAALQEPVIVAPQKFFTVENEVQRINEIRAFANEAQSTLGVDVEILNYINQGYSLEKVKEKVFALAKAEDDAAPVNTANRSMVSEASTAEALAAADEEKKKHEANVQALVKLARK